MWHTILAWIWIALPEVWGNHENLKKVNSPFEVEIPSKEPTFHGVNSSFIFKSIGTLYPTISYVHVRGTINTSVIEEMVETVCDRSERIENFFMAYSKGKLSYMHAEILQRYKNANDAVLEERIGRKSFRVHMQSSIMLLRQSCFHANGIARLALDLLRRNTDDKDKRQILGAAALLFSMYNREELNELSSKVSSTVQNQKHIVHGMEMVMNETDKIKGNMLDLEQEFDQLQRNLSMLEFEHSITELTLLALHENHVDIHEIERLTDVIYTGFHGRLSPKIVTGDTLREALKDVENRAYEQGFRLISNTLTHIYEMDTSVLYHSDGTCDYICHIPIVAIEAELKVLELYDIPFVLHDEKTEDKTKEGSKVWSVETGQNYIVSNAAHSVFYEIDFKELASCKKINQRYFCDQIISRKSTVIDSCLLAIYRQVLHLISKLCRINIEYVKEKAVALNRNQIVLYSQEQISL